MAWKLFARFRRKLASGSGQSPEQLAAAQYREFHRLLESNEAALERMGSLTELLAREEPFAYLSAEHLLGEILESTLQSIEALSRLAGGRHSALRHRLDGIAGEVRRALIGAMADRAARPRSGEPEESEEAARLPDPAWESFKAGPVFQAVNAAALCVTPLELTDPHAASFSPRGCRTAHDVLRYCHEAAIREMFEANRSALRHRNRARRLVFPVPLETFVVDLGGGVAATAGEHSVRPEDITSPPFRALLAGMTTPGLPWSRAVPIELRGFASLVLNSMIDHDRASAEIGSDSCVLVSEHYVNYSARMGYHFASLDAYASPSPHRNYLSYRFKGGAASAVRRVRRASFIAYVLRRWGFTVVQRADHVDASVRKLAEPELLALLREAGRLFGAVRNADVTMYSDAQIELYAEAFLGGASSPVDATRDEQELASAGSTSGPARRGRKE
jgi:hypothetical protein